MAIFTTKHMNQVSKVLREARSECDEQSWEMLVVRFSAMFERSNDRFNPHRFKEDCYHIEEREHCDG